MPIHCPECATQVTDDVRFCKNCGASLRGVTGPSQTREPDGRFDWSKTWVAEMLLTEDERTRRRTALELTGRAEDLVAAEIKRANDLQKEIKSGIITAFAGVALVIFLFIFMGTVADVQDNEKAALILRRLWAVGVIPIMIGLGILVNAVFVSGRFAAVRRSLIEAALAPAAPEGRDAARATGGLRALEAPPEAITSVTEHTTRHLDAPESARNPDRGRD